MESKQWIIKQASVADVQSFFPLFEKNISSQFPEYTDNTRRFFTEKEYTQEVIEASIREDRKYLLLAYDNNKIIGFLLVFKTYGGVGYAEWLAVADEYQRKGVGKTLLKACEEHILADGGHALHLWTSEKNIAYYEKQGFTCVGKVPQGFFGADDFFMYKILRDAQEKNYLRSFLE